MITRKIAKQVFDIAFKDEIAQLHQKHVELMLNKFPDEPTPDEMLEEMREWAKERGNLFRWKENNHPNMFYCGAVIAIQLCPSQGWIEVERNTREEAITEAYRQFKEATSGDN